MQGVGSLVPPSVRGKQTDPGTSLACDPVAWVWATWLRWHNIRQVKLQRTNLKEIETRVMVDPFRKISISVNCREHNVLPVL